MNMSALAALALSVAFAAPPANAATPATTLDPVLHASEGWLNGKVDAASLRGRVVVLDVFTFDCINCKHVVPNLKALHGRYQGKVAIVGIHAPETPYEHERANVIANLARQGIVWPGALDNTLMLGWDYGVGAWPG